MSASPGLEVIGTSRRSELPRHIPGIDLIRGIAAVVVATSHLVQTVTLYLPGVAVVDSPKTRVIADVTREMGAWGVGLFFVLSGFCIHLPLGRFNATGAGPGSFRLPDYAARRFVRIYPPHLAALILSALAGLVLPVAVLVSSPLITRPTLLQFVAHIFMAHPFVPGALFSINSVLWTIAFEAQFYALYPLLVRLSRSRGFGRTTIVLFVVAVLARAAGKFAPPVAAMLLTQTFITRWWEWSLGAWLVELTLSRVPPVSTWRPLLYSSSITFVVGYLMLRVPLGPSAKTILWPCMFGGLVWLACGVRSSSSIAERLASGAGLRGYSLYLIHPIALAAVSWVTLVLPIPLAGRIILGCLGITLMTMMFFRYVERPFLDRAARLKVPISESPTRA